MEKDQTKNIADFTFDEEVTFFNIKPEKSDNKEGFFNEIKDEDEEPIVEKKDKEESKSTDKKTEEDEEEEEFTFGEKPKSKIAEDMDNPPEGEEKEDNEDDKPTGSIFQTLATELKDNGILTRVELKEGEEIDQDRFFEIQREEIDLGIEEGIEAFAENLKADEDTVAFLKFKKDGGRTEDFLKAYTPLKDLSNVDLEKPEDIKKVIAHYLTLQGEDEDEINSRIEYLTENGKAKATATSYKAKIDAFEATRKADVVKEQQEQVKQAQIAAEAFKNKINKTLAETTKVGDFSFEKVNKKEIEDYITKPVVKSGNRMLTKLQADLSEVLQGEDKSKLILLAKLLKTNFDVKDVIVKAASTETKKIQSKLAQHKDVKPTSSGAKGKALADMFN